MDAKSEPTGRLYKREFSKCPAQAIVLALRCVVPVAEIALLAFSVAEDAAAMQRESQQENCLEFFCAVSEQLAFPLVLGRVRRARASQVRHRTLGCIQHASQ